MTDSALNKTAKSKSGPQVSDTPVEPPAPIMMKRSTCWLLTAAAIAASWIASPQVYVGQSTYVWWAVPIVSGIVGVAGWFVAKKRSDN